MLEPEPKRKSPLALPAKVLAACVAAIILSIGLCSVGHFNLEGESSVTANIGVAMFFIGLFGCGISLLWLIIAALTRNAE